jgi:hypothetical protein
MLYKGSKQPRINQADFIVSVINQSCFFHLMSLIP